MRHPPGSELTTPDLTRDRPPTADDLVAEAGRRLAAPGLVVVTGCPGAGRTTLLRRLAEAYRGPVFAGGGLAMLRGVPALALSRAVRARLPAHDPALLAEAVRSRVRGGLLVVDDLQWADPATLAALAPLAAHCRVAAALRTPHRLPPSADQALRDAAVGWFVVPPLTPDAARALIRRTAPGLAEAAISAVLARAGGVPLALQALARHSARLDQTSNPGGPDGSTGTADQTADQTAEVPRLAGATAARADQVMYAVAQALADLTRPARTAMAALGLLGRPATAALLGAGVDELVAAGLVTVSSGSLPDNGAEVAPVSPYVAEVAAGLLDLPARQALHRSLARRVPPAEAARHLAAAGDPTAAYTQAVAAAGRAGTAGEQANLLLFACQLPGAAPPATVRVDAARAALACGRPRAAVGALGQERAATAAALRGEALLQLGDPVAARDAVAAIPDDAPTVAVAGRDRILLLTTAADTSGTTDAADLSRQIIARHGDPPAHPGLRAALAAVHAAQRAPGWEHGLANAAATAGQAGDPLAARWSAWLLVETLAADGRLTEAAQAARTAAAGSAADLAYSWQTRFLAAELWCAALHGAVPDLDGDEVLRRATDLTDRTLPAPARGYATAAASLIQADSGLLAPARARLAHLAVQPGTTGAVVDWVAREAAWLDGQPDQAHHARTAPPGAPPLVDGLRRITARWAAYDAASSQPGGTGDPVVGDSDTEPVGVAVAPVRETLAAWAGDPGRFALAAKAWHDLAIREEVRCLLAQGLRCADPAQAIPALLAAERLAQAAGLVVLHGRVRRALRQHAGHRGTRVSGTANACRDPSAMLPGAVRDDVPRARAAILTGRERDVLRLVAHGEPTRRIARQLGVSAETVETHIRAGMRKLGARTRTAAAALALDLISEQEEAV